MFKKIFFSLIVIALLAFGGLSVYVSTIDWNLHKAKIASQIENLTGKRVVFEGEVDLSFLPRPYLTAKNIKIYNQTGDYATTPLAVINEMVTDLKLRPLLKGNFEIDNMTLQDARILVEFLNDGHLNWYSEISDSQQNALNTVEVALNSVMLNNATVQIVNQELDIDVTLQKLNAEVTAQSLFGPYRIDGSFIKDGYPAGFALNLGTISESFGTSLILVLTHPDTESSARFDGQILSGNSEIEGSFDVRSQNPANFVNSLTNQEIIPAEFNYPLQGSVNLKVNPQQLDLSSLVIKYGDNTAGAGHLLIPFMPEKGQEKPIIQFTFDFTNLELEPLVGVLRQQLKMHDQNKAPYTPDFAYDVTADINAVKAYFKDEDIRNFIFSGSLVNDIISIRNLSGLLPGDTDISVTGDVFENDQKLTYDFKINSTSQDFFKFLKWIDLEPQTYAPSTYRGAQASMRLSGNLDQIKISPLSFSVDNNQLSGMIGIVRDQRTQLFIALQSDKINFDNYLPQLTDDEQKLSMPNKIKSVLNRFEFLNPFDIHFESKLNIGIYHKTPFEKLDVNFDSKDKVITINKFHIDEIVSSSLDLKGKLSGLGSNPTVENLKYEFISQNFAAFKDKFEVPAPQWPLFNNAQKVRANGILSGNTESINIKAVTNVDEPFLKSVYTGKLFNQNDKFNFHGKLEFNTEFVRFINSLGYNYKPSDLPSAIFTFKGIVSGTPDSWSAQNINSFISANNFQGNFSVDIKDGRPAIRTDLSTNRLEFDRLFYNPGKKSRTVLNKQDSNVAFITKPRVENINIDYELYKEFDLNGKFAAKILNYQSEEWSNATTEVEIKNGLLAVRNFKADVGRTLGEKPLVTASFQIDMNGDPKVKGTAQITNLILESFGGEKYGLESGHFKARLDFDAPAHSQMAFLDNFTGKLSFDIEKAVFKGWNLKAIETDLAKRDTSEGLYEMARDNLESGTTSFDLIGSEIEFQKGEFNLNNTVFSNNFALVDASGKGNLKNWNADINFILTLENLKDKSLPILFTWKGNLANPIVKVDVDQLKEKYDSYWAQIAKEKREAEEARIKALNDAMNKTQEVVVDLREMVEKDIMPLIETYKPQSFNAEIKSVYDSNYLQLIDINNQLEVMATKANEDYTMEEIAEMDIRLETLEPLLVEILRQINENIINDTKLHAGNAYKAIVNIYDNSKDKAVNYQQTLTAYANRLVELNSLIILDRELRVLDYKNSIETSLRTIEDLRAQANKTKDIIQESDNKEDVTVKKNMMEEIRNHAEQELQKLNISLEELFTYAQQLIREEESRKPATARKAQKQSTQNPVKTDPPLSADKSNPTDVELSDETTPVEDQVIETEVMKPSPSELESSPDLVSEQPEVLIKPLVQEGGDVITYSSRAALSGKITKSSGRSRETKAETSPAILPSTGSLLRPIQDEPTSVSGTIKKK